jgi:tetratricopeptide (TPR) repeat protein
MAGAHLYDEEHVQAAQGDRTIDMEEIAREHCDGLGAQEPPPCRPGALRRRRDPQPSEDPPHRGGSDPDADAEQFALDALGPPAGILLTHPPDQHHDPDIDQRSAGLTGIVHRQRASRRCQRSSASGVTRRLIRAYAAEQAQVTGNDTDRREATGRMLDHYLQTAHAATLLLRPSREPITRTPAQPGVTPEHLAGRQQALSWFQAEHHVLLAAVTLADNAGFDVHAWQIPWTMTNFLDRRGHWHELAAIQRTALAAATRLGDKAGQATARRLLAGAYTRLADYEEARIHSMASLEIYQESGDQAGQAYAHLALSLIAEEQERYADALSHDEQALRLFQALDHKAGQAAALNAVGWDHTLLGHYEQARVISQQALALSREAGERVAEARAWDSLGYAEHHLRRHAQAVNCYRHALRLARELGDRHLEAETLTHIGDTHQATGQLEEARQALQQALAILDDLHHPDADQVRSRLLTT